MLVELFLPTSLGREHWPETKVQRCLSLSAREHPHPSDDLPATEAGKELLALTQATYLDHAAAWTEEFGTWRPLGILPPTSDLREEECRQTSPRRSNLLWWYKHLGLRRARGSLVAIVKAGHIFTRLSSAVDDQNIARTTSPLEGGVNAGLKDLLRGHRGLSPDHPARAVDPGTSTCHRTTARALESRRTSSLATPQNESRTH
jgi:hypothetical protein